MRTGQARKRDGTEKAIVAALRAIGATVYSISGAGVADLLVYFRGQWTPVEVKRPGGKLTSAQRHTIQQTPYPVVSSVAEALQLFGVGVCGHEETR